MHDAYIGGRSENNIKCVVMHNDLGRKNRTTRYNCRFSAASLALQKIFLSFIVVEHIQFFHGAIQFFAVKTSVLCLDIYLHTVALSAPDDFWMIIRKKSQCAYIFFASVAFNWMCALALRNVELVEKSCS